MSAPAAAGAFSGATRRSSTGSGSYLPGPASVQRLRPTNAPESAGGRACVLRTVRSALEPSAVLGDVGRLCGHRRSSWRNTDVSNYGQVESRTQSCRKDTEVCASRIFHTFCAWARIFRPFGAAFAAHFALPDLVNEPLTQDTSRIVQELRVVGEEWEK